MKFFRMIALALVATLAMSLSAVAGDYNTSNYHAQGGSDWVVNGTQEINSGGTLEVKSGGLLIMDPGSLLDNNPTFSTNILSNPSLKLIRGTATVAQINTGATLLAAATGRTIYIHDVKVKAVGGNVATCDYVTFNDTANSPVSAIKFSSAGLVSGTILGWNTSGATPGAGFNPEGLTAGKGLTIGKTGGSCGTATAVDYEVTYAIQ